MLYKASYFLEPCTHSKNKTQVELDLSSNYATKFDLKEQQASINADLANLKSDFDRLDIDKLEILLAEFSKLSNIIKNDFVKNIVYDWLIKKVNAIHSNKQKFEKKIQDVDKKIPGSEGLINYQQIFMQE